MNKLNNKYPTVIAIIGFIFVIVLSIYVAVLTTQFNDAKKEQIISNTQSYYAVSKLEFCLNKAITPCSDAALSEWNSKHSDDSFKLKSFQDLVEEGIEQYSNARK